MNTTATRTVKSFDRTYSHLFGHPPPSSVHRGHSSAVIIAPGRGFMGGFDLTMQVQVGCPGGCLFCYVPPAFRLTPSAVRGPQGRHWGFEVRDKADVPGQLRKLLARGALADQSVYWSGVTDPYAAPPGVTKQVWDILTHAACEQGPRRVVVQTRFAADRDAPGIAGYCRNHRPLDDGPAALVSFSLGTDRDDLIRAWERATPRFEQRMKSIRTLREAGVFVVATLSPLGLWNDLQGTLRRLNEWGVAYITTLFFKTSEAGARTPRLFIEYLQAHHPELLDPSWQAERVQEMVEVCGERRVLVGRAGFASLAKPHLVLGAAGGPGLDSRS